MNTAYAHLASEADAADRIATPTFLAAGADPDELVADAHRKSLDDWLAEPFGRQAEQERALLAYLKGA